MNGYNEDDYLMISGIQHFNFCRRQWALIHLEEKWNENRLTAEGRANHERVHNPEITDTRNGVISCHGMNIKSSRLGITGSCDSVEFVPSEDGITLHGKSGKWILYPVEYKHGSSKAGDCDRLQLAAQIICLEEMFCCEIPEAFIFYHETRRREKVDINTELRNSVEKSFVEMHDLYKRGYTPKVKYNPSCKNCSLSEICLPEIGKSKVKSVSEYLKSAFSEDKDEETT